MKVIWKILWFFLLVTSLFAESDKHDGETLVPAPQVRVRFPKPVADQMVYDWKQLFQEFCDCQSTLGGTATFVLAQSCSDAESVLQNGGIVERRKPFIAFYQVPGKDALLYFVDENGIYVSKVDIRKNIGKPSESGKYFSAGGWTFQLSWQSKLNYQGLDLKMLGTPEKRPSNDIYKDPFGHTTLQLQSPSKQAPELALLLRGSVDSRIKDELGRWHRQCRQYLGLAPREDTFNQSEFVSSVGLYREQIKNRFKTCFSQSEFNKIPGAPFAELHKCFDQVGNPSMPKEFPKKR